MLFNDVIVRVAVEHHASVIDLRLVCNESTELRERDRAVRSSRAQDRACDRSSDQCLAGWET
jgi:hypothetical protein